MSQRKGESLKKKKAQELEYCRGWYDANGIWNNGFQCPRWGGPDRSYCCGDESDRYCCTPGAVEQNPAPEPDNLPDSLTPSIAPAASPASTSTDSTPLPFSSYIPYIAGAGVGFLVILLIIIFCCCFCHPKCPYKRRKRNREMQNSRNAPCPACRHSARMPVVIANERGEPMSRDDGSDASRPPSYCPVCREEGLRWQHGVNDVNILFPREDPPPYTHDGEGDKSDDDDKYIHYDTTLRFTSFMGSSPDITQTNINRPPPALLHHTDTHLKYLARTPDLTHHPISMSLYPGEMSDDGSESSLSKLSRIPVLLNTETRRLAMLRD